MAIISQNYVDWTGLQAYDTLIKNWANSANQLGYKTILKSADGNTLNLYKKANAILGTDTPDATVALGGGDIATQLDALAAIVNATYDSENHVYTLNGVDSTFTTETQNVVNLLNELKGQINTLNANDQTTGSVAKAIKDAINALDVTEFAVAEVSNNVVTIHGVKEVDGQIEVGTSAANDIVLEEVAYTGAAADVSIADVGEKITATNVEDAIAELADAAADQAVYVTDNTSTAGTDYATIYKIYQGTGSAASPVADELVGTINIPKDQFVDDAELVDITYDNGRLYDGLDDVTELIKGEGGTATAADAGKYFKLVFELASGPSAKSTIYISIKELSHVYTGGDTAEVSVSIDSATDEITATIVDINGSKITYIAADATQGIARESVNAALTRLDGADTVTGSVAKKVKDAIDALDTVNDVNLATVNTTTGTILFKGSMKEINGVIESGDGDDVSLTPITTAQINSLFS